MSTASDFQKGLRRLAAEYQNIQTARLGRLDGVTVETGTAGLLWARQWNGKEIRVVNRALVPGRFDLRVLVGTVWSQPGKWFILQTMEDYLTPAAGGQIAYHVPQHQFMGSDMGMWDRRQIIQLSCLVKDAAAFTVQIYGAVVPTASGLALVDNEVLDLSGEVPAAGAVYVLVEVDDAGDLSLHTGSNFGSPLAANASYYPQPDPGKYPIYAVLLYEGQAELSNDDIKPILSVGAIAKDAGLQAHEATPGTPASLDEVGWWSTSAAALRSATWTHVLNMIVTHDDSVIIHQENVVTL